MAAVAEVTDAAEQHEVSQSRQVGALPVSEIGGEQFGGPLSSIFAGEPPAATTARLSHPSLSHPANTVFRSSAFKRAQQTRGNHFVQRAIIQGTQSPGPLIQRECACGGTCSTCNGFPSAVSAQPPAGKLESNSLIQTKRTPGSTNTETATHDFTIPTGGGEPLAEAPRNLMEARFGRDLGDVRVHTDDKASASAEALQANAFTSGRDIYFGRGKYAPESSDGQFLLAHELTHSIQQSDGALLQSATFSGNEVTISRHDDPLEHEANQVG